MDDFSPNTKQLRALRLLAVAAIAALGWIARPVGVGLLLGALVAFTLQPAYRRLRLCGLGASRAAALCVTVSMVLIGAAVALFAVVFVSHGIAVVQWLPSSLAPGGRLRVVVERILTAAHFDPATAVSRIEEQAMTLGSRAAGVAAHIASVTLESLLTWFFMILAGYYVLRHWDEIVKHLEELSPLLPQHTRALLGEFRLVGSEVLRGTVLTGLIQGVFAGIGYWIFGIPDPAFLGALTALASLVPAVGTLLVWVPAGIYLMSIGKFGHGLGELIFAALIVVILTDYVIRPKLVGSHKGMPTILTFIALFGGIEVFGVIGLVLGPVIVTLCLAILRTYEQATQD